jgi:hypothetical protein
MEDGAKQANVIPGRGVRQPEPIMKCAFDPTYLLSQPSSSHCSVCTTVRPPPGFVLTGHPQSYSGPEVRFWDMMRDVGLVAIKDVIIHRTVTTSI